MINNNLKNIKFGLISLFISLFLVACVTKPTEINIPKWDFTQPTAARQAEFPAPQKTYSKEELQSFNYGNSSVPKISANLKEDQLKSLNYGTYPKNYKKIIDKYLFTVLKDPSSKQIEYLNEPRKGVVQFDTSKIGINAGYAVCAYVNAKNGFGGYTGAKLSYFVIHNDDIIEEFMSAGNFTDEIATEYCAKLGVL